MRYPEIKGLSPATFKFSFCDIWGIKKVSMIENQLIKIDIPVLLISGDYDVVTPSGWASKLKNDSTNSFYIIFKSWKHAPTTNWSNQCAMKAANDFFNNPGLKPNADCLDEIKTPKFEIE